MDTSTFNKLSSRMLNGHDVIEVWQREEREAIARINGAVDDAKGKRFGLFTRERSRLGKHKAGTSMKVKGLLARLKQQDRLLHNKEGV